MKPVILSLMLVLSGCTTIYVISPEVDSGSSQDGGATPDAFTDSNDTGVILDAAIDGSGPQEPNCHGFVRGSTTLHVIDTSCRDFAQTETVTVTVGAPLSCEGIIGIHTACSGGTYQDLIGGGGSLEGGPPEWNWTCNGTTYLCRVYLNEAGNHIDCTLDPGWSNWCQINF